MAFTGRTPGGKSQEGVRALFRRSFVNPHDGSRPGSMPGLTGGDRWTGQRSHLGGVPAEYERSTEYRRYTCSHARRRVPATRPAWASCSVRPSPFRPPSKPDPGRKPAILPLRLLRRLSPWCTKSSSTTVRARRKIASPTSGAPAWRSSSVIPKIAPAICSLRKPSLPPRISVPIPRCGAEAEPPTKRPDAIVALSTGDSFQAARAGHVPPHPGNSTMRIREENPNRRQRTVLRTWFREATNSQILWGWIEESVYVAHARGRHSSCRLSSQRPEPLPERIRQAEDPRFVTREVLHLPEPARTLLHTTFETIDGALGEIVPEGRRWRLGGGTVLAARWMHRKSTDRRHLSAGQQRYRCPGPAMEPPVHERNERARCEPRGGAGPVARVLLPRRKDRGHAARPHPRTCPWSRRSWTDGT